MSSPPQGLVATSVISTELWFDVRDFGATGNGTTDDTTAIQNAVNTIPSTGGMLYFPSGTYLISSVITFAASMYHLRAAGPSGFDTAPPSVIIKWNSASAGNMFNITLCRGFKLEGFQFAKATGALVTGIAAGASDARNNRFTFKDVSFVSLNVGIDCLSGSTTQGNYDTTIDDSIFVSCTTGIILAGNMFSFYNVKWQTCPTGVLCKKGSAGSSIASAAFYACTWVGGANQISTDSSITEIGGLSFAHCHFETSTTGIIQIQAANTVIRTISFSDECYFATANTVAGSMLNFTNATGTVSIVGCKRSRATAGTDFTITAPITIALRVSACDSIDENGIDTLWEQYKYKNSNSYGENILGVTLQRSEIALDNNVLTLTPVAIAGCYRLHFAINVSAATAATLGWTATWKDSNGTAQAPTNLDLIKNGVAAPALTFLAAAGDTYVGDTMIDIDNSATNIVCKLTFTGTSFTAKVSAIIEQMA